MSRTVKGLALALSLSTVLFAQDSSGDLRRTFQDPPPDARPMMRWWWFGPSVTKPEFEKELNAMRGAGIGGVEIQPVYPLMLDGQVKGFQELPILIAGVP
jgi:hypothetical protein